MDTKKILIADASPGFCQSLARKLDSGFHLKVCHDGRRALSLLESFRPDFFLVDLALPEIDGISVLESLSDLPVNPTVMVTTRYSSPYIEQAVHDLQVDYVVMKPCEVDSLTERIQDLSTSAGDSVLYPPDLRSTVAGMLTALGITSRRKGFSYLVEAIYLYLQNPSQAITAQLYPTVAKRFRTTTVAVERDIRTAIQTAWQCRNEKMWNIYFPFRRYGFHYRPTNSAFIAVCAQFLEHQAVNSR